MPGERLEISAESLATQISDSSASGIGAAVLRLIRTGELSAGSALPTVRELAQKIGVSPATVSAAWNILRKQRAIDGAGRQGVRVLAQASGLAPQRFDNISKYWRTGVLNLTRAVPDPALLPDIRAFLAQAPVSATLNSYERVGITEHLEAAARATWPWNAQSMLAVNGGYDGILLAASALVMPGQAVAVADPATARTLDIFDMVGARIVPVATDADGPIAASLAAALKSEPALFVYEPNTTSRLGTSLTAMRREQLAALIAPTSTLVVEDDGQGMLSPDAYAGMGEELPAATIHIRSYAKSHGPDLRVGIVAGPAEPLERIRAFRHFGSGWTSQLLQDGLAAMLTSAEVTASLAAARAVYAERRAHMQELLRSRGFAIADGYGLSIWVPVLNEQQALLILASHGVAASGAATGAIREQPPAVRLATGNTLADPEGIADLYALAARAV